MSITKTTLKELSEYIDNERESLNNDYEYLFDNVRAILHLNKLSSVQNTHLQWYLASIHSDTVTLTQRLKDLQKELNDASKTIQD